MRIALERIVVSWLVFLLGVAVLPAQFSETGGKDRILGHPVVRDAGGGVLAWYQPDKPGRAYAQVARLASEFILEGTPIDPKTGRELYYISCCFQGPHMRLQKDFKEGVTWEDWMHNPACVWAGLVQSLVLDYRVFSGDDRYTGLVRKMLDYQIKNGTTPPDWAWPKVPFASSDPGETVYRGATRWEHDGMRGDGLDGIEPDKIGDLGYAYLKFFQVTEERAYLEAAFNCADVLARHIRDVSGDEGVFSAAVTQKSPWPFRVNGRTGVVISEYSSNVIDPIRLFDEMLRSAGRITLTAERSKAYRSARDSAWKWLYSKNGPMITFIWNGYFEDVPNDPDRANRVQITALETARYLLKHPDLDPNLNRSVRAMVHWVSSAFATDGMDAIKEQTWCFVPMGSHTARYASICALMYERTGEEWFRDQAFRFFNFATYMTFENGVVAVGPEWPGSWFSDGYGDYIRHFMEGMAAIPEWAPADRDHLLRSSSAVQSIHYGDKEIDYCTYDPTGSEVLRLASQPELVLVNQSPLAEDTEMKGEGWHWRELEEGGVLKLRRLHGRKVRIVRK